MDINQMMENPEVISREIEEFGKTVDCTYDDEGVKKYPDEWVGAHSGEIQTHGPTIESVVQQLKEMGFPMWNAHIRFISSKPTILIL